MQGAVRSPMQKRIGRPGASHRIHNHYDWPLQALGSMHSAQCDGIFPIVAAPFGPITEAVALNIGPLRLEFGCECGEASDCEGTGASDERIQVCEGASAPVRGAKRERGPYAQALDRLDE